MAPRYAHVHVEGNWGIRLGNRSIRIEVWDKDDRKIGMVSVGKTGVEVSGKGRGTPTVVKWDDLNR
jgi:hypothetical protein